MNREEELHRQVVDYLRLQYPSVLFRTDMSGVRLTPGLRAKTKRVQGIGGFPDIFVYEPRGVFFGLAIELKRAGTRLYKKDGSMVANLHYKEQAETLKMLQERGYMACFCVGWEETKQIIDMYLSTGQ